jgi:oligopeptide transport system substrate-binding protein
MLFHQAGRGFALTRKSFHSFGCEISRLALVAPGLVLLLAGCLPSRPAADLVIVNGAEPESLDPAVMTGQADLRAGGAVFEGLTRYKAVDGTPEPGLAERWDLSPDARTYVFHLRPQAAWSTGEPITAQDFVYSWRRILDPRTGCEYAGVLFYLKNGEEYQTGQVQDPAQVGVRALDEHTLEVELSHPTMFFLDLCALPTLAVVPRAAIERHGDRWLVTPPVPASGAYELESWRINDRIRLRKNSRYWDAANTRSEVVDLLPCVNANTALNLYETRAADIVWDKNLVPSELLDLLLDRPDFHHYPVLSSYFLRFNVTRKPFDDLRVRQAFAHAVDRERIVKKVTRAGELPASSYTPPIIPGYTPPPGLMHDPEAARRLLAEAGYRGGQGFPAVEYLFDTTTRLQEQVAIELQEMWQRELGVRVGLRKLEWKTYLVAQRDLDYDLCRGSWVGDYSDPNTFLDMFMSRNGNNRTGWKNERYDQLLREANAQVDPAKRLGLLQQAETLLVRVETPIVPLYVYTGIEYYDTNEIHGVFSNPRAEHPIRAIWKTSGTGRRPSAAASPRRAARKSG